MISSSHLIESGVCKKKRKKKKKKKPHGKRKKEKKFFLKDEKRFHDEISQYILLDSNGGTPLMARKVCRR